MLARMQLEHKKACSSIVLVTWRCVLANICVNVFKKGEWGSKDVDVIRTWGFIHYIQPAKFVSIRRQKKCQGDLTVWKPASAIPRYYFCQGQLDFMMRP